MTQDFHGRTALVTGAASGIGLAVVQALARRGTARIVAVDIDPAALNAIEADCTIDRAAGDVRDENFWTALAPRLEGIDHAVINAGVASAAPIADCTLDEWRRTLSINLDGAFLTFRAAMRAIGGHGRGGSIVATASAAGLKAEPGVAAYGASKAGLIQLAKVAAKEGAPSNIRVNAIAPAGVETPVWDSMPFFRDLVQSAGSREAAFAELAKMATPLGRYATADEIATQIAFLLSDDAALITGSVLVSDGGYLL